MKRVLVIVAHPDDEVLGCGGTLAARHASDEIQVVVLADGETSGDADLSNPRVQLVEARRGMAREAARVLEIAGIEFLGFPDQQLDALPLLELNRRLQPIVNRFRPHVVYTHSQADLNLDHRITGQAALTCCRPLPGDSVEEIYAFQVPASDWGFGQVGRQFLPNSFVDVGKTLDRKLEAIACYETELREPPHPHSLEGIRHSCQRWGSLSGVDYAEAFELVRSVRRG